MAMPTTKRGQYGKLAAVYRRLGLSRHQPRSVRARMLRDYRENRRVTESNAGGRPWGPNGE
jgi:hypothetical protein